MSRIHLANDETIAEAAKLLRAGELVAFPTETVYGLGADATNAAAVRKIFVAKGRPATNPIIVHVADAKQVGQVAAEWPAIAQKLAERFWPGPLTLVVAKNPALPSEVTAGGPTVAVRSPAHPVARALLAAVGVPLAAPSANRSTQLSPTTAQHVAAGLGDDVAMILDGGPCASGIESTVLDVTTDPPRILRPGPITAADIERVIGVVPSFAFENADSSVARSPGQMARHYSPRTRVEIVPGDGHLRVRELMNASGQRVGWLTWPDAIHPDARRAGFRWMDFLWPLFSPGVFARRDLPREPVAYAAGLYAALHELDAANCDRIIVATVPDGPEWDAIRDRLRRASAAPDAS